MRIYTGLQPTGDVTIGNYIGSLRNFSDNLQGASSSFITVVDLHALTVNRDSNIVKEDVKKLTSLLFALDFHKKSNVFIQSEIKEHAELTWPLLTFTKMGELERMTQFKDKSKKAESINVGLFTYPVLMASDILLYDATHVPVGQDQKQHLELARVLANRVNNFYDTELFTIPEPIIKKEGAKIYSLTDPSKKMSKSDENPKSYVSIFDDEKTIMKKVKSATTDSLGVINFDEENQPGVSNLLIIFKELNDLTMEDTLKYFYEKQYGFLKEEVANCIINHVAPIQEKYQYYLENYDEVRSYLDENNKNIEKIASDKLKLVHRTMGL